MHLLKTSKWHSDQDLPICSDKKKLSKKRHIKFSIESQMLDALLLLRERDEQNRAWHMNKSEKKRRDYVFMGCGVEA